MAAIGQIRKHSILLLALVGGAMLLFVLGGALESGSIFLNDQNTDVGEINGNLISYQEFANRVAELESNSRGQVTDQQRQQLREQVWNDMLRTEIMDVEYKALGVAITDEELLDIIKNDPNNANLKQYFSDPQTGQVVAAYANPDGSLNGAAVIDYLKRVVYADTEQSAEAKSSWLNFQENYLRKPALLNKYASLLSQGIFLTDVEVQRTEQDQNSRISFMYAASYYNDTPDEEIDVTEAEIKAYYNAHKNDPEFRQDELSAGMRVVSFAVEASEADKENLKAELGELKQAFENSTEDTLFVNENGDTPFNLRWMQEGSFPVEYDTLIANAEAGTVIGPFLNQNKFELVKVLERKMGPDSVKASHILIQIGAEGEEAVQATIDSLKAEVEANDNFADLAKTFSADPGSAAQGGDLGWFTEGQMVPEFNDACFNGKPGDMVSVKTQFGIHLIRIEEQTEPKPKVKIGIVDNMIEPSLATYEKAYNTASTFAITNDTPEKFAEAADADNLIPLEAPSISQSDLNVLNRPNSREIVRWAFEAEVGDVSAPFEVGNEFLVCVLTEIRAEGVLPFDIVENECRLGVIKEKKAKMFAEKMQGSDVKQVAAAAGVGVQPASDVPFSAFSIPGLGNEQKLLGMAYSLEAGQTSLPIEGDRGVYVVMIENVEIPEATEVTEAKRSGMMSASAGRASFEAFEALKDNAEIVDNRWSFF